MVYPLHSMWNFRHVLLDATDPFLRLPGEREHIRHSLHFAKILGVSAAFPSSRHAVYEACEGDPLLRRLA